MNLNSSKPVMGLKVFGDELIQQQIQVDSTFEKCPIAHAAGIPLYVKRLYNQKYKRTNHYIIVRMMSDPAIGLAPNDWQYGGALGPAPTVLVARSDGVQFSTGDWCVLDEFEDAMLDDGPRNVSRKDFVSYVKVRQQNKNANIVLEARYAKGIKCKINGLLKSPELNGKIGICNGTIQNSRIGVQLEGSEKDFAIKPANLQIINVGTKI